MSTLHRRLADLAAREPDAVAMIGLDGVRVTRAGLLALASAAAAAGDPGIAPPATDPVAVVASMIGAQAAGGTELRLITSGSTGRARVIRRSVTSWTASLSPLNAVVGLDGAGPGRDDSVDHDDVLWAPGAPSSTMTVYAVWQGLAAGVPVLATGPWRGVGDCVRDAARRSRWLHAVPVVLESILHALAADAERGVPWRLRTAVVAGAAHSPELRERAGRLGVRLVEYYGAAELSFVAVDGDGSGLRPFPGVEVQIRGEVLWARSPYLADEADGVPVRDDDGWASAGDRARWRDDGALQLLGREAAANVAGHIVHLAEVEAVLAAVHGVAEVVCLAAPDDRFGQRVVAVVRPTGGTAPRSALRAAASTLPAAARPIRYHVVGELPRTPAGKVDLALLAGSVLDGPRVEGPWSPAMQ